MDRELRHKYYCNMDCMVRYGESIFRLTALISELTENLKEVMSSLRPSSAKLSEIRNEYNIGRNIGFNIFTSISDTYYKENFHSDVLKLILDPGTDIIGDPRFIREFLKILNTINSNVDTAVSFSEQVKVEREEGRIDLLIQDKTYAIIIENKINDAVDQPDQLARYFRYVSKDKNLQVLAIVYLPLTLEKKPPLEYSKEYAECRDDIRKKLVCLPAINGMSKTDYAHGFLDRCAELSTDQTAKVYINQYSQLVKHLGGQAMMTETEKQIIREIYSSEESLNVVKDIVEIWPKRNELLLLVIYDKLREEPGFMVHSDDKNTVYKRIKNNDDISLGFERLDGSLGFVYSPGKNEINPGLALKLKGLLEEDKLEQCFTQVQVNDEWVWQDLKIDEIKGSLEDIINVVGDRVETLESRASSLLLDKKLQ